MRSVIQTATMCEDVGSMRGAHSGDHLMGCVLGLRGMTAMRSLLSAMVAAGKNAGKNAEVGDGSDKDAEAKGLVVVELGEVLPAMM